MVKITLYNIGEYKKKQVLYCFVDFFLYSCLCIPNSLKEPKKICIWNIMYQCFVYSPLRVLHKSVSSSNLQRYPFSHTASTLYMNQSMMASPCKLNKNNFYVHVYKRNKNAIIYIYIIYRNMKVIISKFLNINFKRKKFLTSLLIFIILYIVRKLTTTVGFIVMNFVVVISY